MIFDCPPNVFQAISPPWHWPWTKYPKLSSTELEDMKDYIKRQVESLKYVPRHRQTTTRTTTSTVTTAMTRTSTAITTRRNNKNVENPSVIRGKLKTITEWCKNCATTVTEWLKNLFGGGGPNNTPRNKRDTKISK